MRDIGPLVGAIDQGTSSTRFLVFTAQTGELVTYHQMEVKRIMPIEGWVEQDPIQIYNSVVECIDIVAHKLQGLDIDIKDIKCIGLTNQRESTIIWDKYTGHPFYNCIVWLDNRTSELVDIILDHIPGRDLNWFKPKTGLPISTYFSALKLKWLIDNIPGIKAAIVEKRLLFGTVDSWLLWKLTGQHRTDVTNASRTLLMDLETLEWDPYLLDFFKIPKYILPEIKASSDYFGEIITGALTGIPITGVIGDQSGALVGQKCFEIGQAKVTYGTGCFLIQNIGPGPIHGALKGVSKDAIRSLVTTVAYKIGSEPVCYALEGSVAIAGAAVTWLRDNLELIQSYNEIESIASEDQCAGGLFFVPAFQGLYAPYWDANATGTIIGISQFSRKCHLVRATLEGVAFQTNDILMLMRPDNSGIKVDGGMSANNLLCQILADISGLDIVRPKFTEATALGAAMMAGHHMGLWKIIKETDSEIDSDHEMEKTFIRNGKSHDIKPASGIPANKRNGLIRSISRRLSQSTITRKLERTFSLGRDIKIYDRNFDVFRPKLAAPVRLDRINTWKLAVSRSRKWIRVDKQEQKRTDYKRLSSIPFMLYVLMSFGTHILSQSLIKN
ncbi:glycerol kinase-like [Oppia nitens]|uniref:glycerol kinase-like n=1 Tax=Oppia nitens TaxID=1686743 RepID=UPI0023DC3263|nr:glycerol kinase-like [Oppia nitens]